MAYLAGILPKCEPEQTIGYSWVLIKTEVKQRKRMLRYKRKTGNFIQVSVPIH